MIPIRRVPSPVALLLVFTGLLALHLPAHADSSPSSPLARVSADPALLKEIDLLEHQLRRFRDDHPYLVIDTMNNRYQIRGAGELLQEAACATGSGKVLLGPKGVSWHFETPKGAFRILRKVKDPIWSKPEWAFVEKGRKAPILPWEFDRLDPTTLGSYAIELGDGYEIHGTLYPDLLGRHITHGCVRLDDEMLATTYDLTQTGNRVYIY